MEEAKPQEAILVGVVGPYKVKDRVRRKGWKAHPQRVKDPYSKTKFS